MMHRFRTSGFVAVVLLTASSTSARAADVLAEVPGDALGFVVVHDLAAVDAKLGRLADTLQRSLPRPLSFLQEVTGIHDGIRTDGDFLLALFPARGGHQMRYCVWLPVADYGQFLKSIHATSQEGIAAATIAGEDLLVARHGDWALLVDPDQRTWLTALTAGKESPLALPAWRTWIDSNDVTLVALAPGLHHLVGWLGDAADTRRQSNDNPYGPLDANDDAARRVDKNPARSPANLLDNVRLQFQKWLAAAPELAQLAQQVPAVACGVRLDDHGNAGAELRVALDRDLASEFADAAHDQPAALPFSSYAGGGFAVSGAGRFPAPVLTGIAAAYLRRTAADLKSEEQTELDQVTLDQIEVAAAQAVSNVQSLAVLNQPGESPEPVYTNSFVTVRSSAVNQFIENAHEVMRLWNKANRDARQGTRLIFDVEQTKVGDHAATLYSLDVAALDGNVALPEVRQAMERLFGPGGKLRLWVVAADENTVLLAAATPEQVASAVNSLQRKQTIDWNNSGAADAQDLLPADSAWRLFVDLHRYSIWREREALAMIGVPVIGGTLVNEFPESPPIGFAGRLHDGDLSLHFVVPANTLKNAALFFARAQRNSSPLRGGLVPPRQR